MKTMANNLNNGRPVRAFTLVELLTVISIIGVIAALVVAVLPAAKRKKDEAAVKAQHAKLLTQIEDYKQKFGTYPPDDPAWAATRPAWNPLAYELGGTRRSGVNFVSELDPTHTITTVGPAQLNSYFGAQLAGFVNASANATTRAKSFLGAVGGSGQSATYVYLTNGVPGMPAAMFLQVPAEHPAGGNNVWRYRAYPANGHNPKSFDLWAEYGKTGSGRTNIHGNWR